MLQRIEKADTELFLWLNGLNASWLDRPMWLFSEKLFWIPVYLVLLYFLYRRYPGYQFFLIILAIALSITINDRTSVELFKNMVHRLRPSHEPALNGLIHLVADENGNLYKGGTYGFFSSHAANYAGVATLFILLMRPLKPIAIFLLVLWVAVILYSRIYLGVHYPGDILAGALFGAITGWIVFRIFCWMRRKIFTTS